MSHKIWGVAYPEMVFEIIGHSLKHGTVSLYDAQDILQAVRNKSKAEGYVILCLHAGLLQSPTGSHPANLSSLVSTPRGRQLYCVAEVDRGKATHEVLGSMPAYRFHAELLLAELLLTGSIRGTIQPHVVMGRIAQDLPWFLEDRLPWIQQSVGWTDSSSYRATDLQILHNKVLGLADLPEVFYDEKSYALIDAYMGFSSRTSTTRYFDHYAEVTTRGSDLTKVENLCAFLEEQHSKYLYMYAEMLAPQALILLLLLIMAESDGMAVDVGLQSQALRQLLRSGVQVHYRDGRACLGSAVKVVFRTPLEAEHAGQPATRATDRKGDFFGALRSAAAHLLSAEPLKEVLTLDLQPLRQNAVDSSVGQLVFMTSELGDPDTDSPPSVVEIWRTQHLWAQTSISFQENVIQVCQGTHPNSAAILLTRREIDNGLGAGLASALGRIPHLYLLLMLLIDQAQSHVSPTLQENVWCYAGTELLPFLDMLLRSLGYIVWSEGYDCDAEAREELAKRLVAAMIDMRCASVQFGRLELAPDFENRLTTDYAYLQNQTRGLRLRLRHAKHFPLAPS